MADAKGTQDKVLRLKKYVEGLKQRINSGTLSAELKNVLEIDLRKTEAVIAKLG